VQLNSRAECPGFQSQFVPLSSWSGSPFNNYYETEREKFTTELPLEPLYSLAHRFIAKSNGEVIHPFIGR
jgi:hypothetical protein